MKAYANGDLFEALGAIAQIFAMLGYWRRASINGSSVPIATVPAGVGGPDNDGTPAPALSASYDYITQRSNLPGLISLDNIVGFVQAYATDPTRLRPDVSYVTQIMDALIAQIHAGHSSFRSQGDGLSSNQGIDAVDAMLRRLNGYASFAKVELPGVYPLAVE